MEVSKLPPTLQKYVDYMASENRPLGFSEIVAITPRVNLFRKLEQRGLIVNVVKGYEPGEPYTGPRMSKYVLTEAGKRHVSQQQS